jgi:hypothetical protein
MPRKGRPGRASAHVDHAARGGGELQRSESPSPCERYPLREFVTQVVVDWRCVATLLRLCRAVRGRGCWAAGLAAYRGLIDRFFGLYVATTH